MRLFFISMLIVVFFVFGCAAKHSSPDIPTFVEQLRDNATAKAAQAALVEIGEPAIPALIELLGDERVEVRIRTAFVLKDIGEPSLPWLIRALSHEKPLARGYAAFALGRMKQNGAAAIPTLVRAYHEDTDFEARRSFLFHMAEIDINNSLVAETLAEVLLDEEMAEHSLLGLIVFGKSIQDNSPIVELAVAHENKGVRVLLLGVLGARGHNTFPLIAQYWVNDDEAAEMRAEMLELWTDTSMAELTAVLRSSDPEQLNKGILSARILGPEVEEVIPDLVTLLRAESPYIRAAALDALLAIAPDREEAFRKILP